MDKDVPWVHILPKRKFMEKFKNFVSALSSAEESVTNNEYSHFFIETNKILGELYACQFDVDMAKHELEKTASAALTSFLKASKNAIAEVPQYSRVSTKTGRLTVKSGPQILTLKKEYREVLKSRFVGGSLFEIDFTSLEPRVAFNITAGEKLLPGEKSPADLYQFFIEKTRLDIQRDTAKLAVLCSLYGAGTSKLRSVLQKDGSTFSADILVKKVEYFFGIRELFKTLCDQAETGYITNFYGRPIEVTDARKNILVNNFLQSTAVDVALAGFCEIVENIPACKPVFIIHDALIMDVPKGQEDRLQDIVSQGFNDEKMGHFPLKLMRLK
jgi:DNA polymerase I-like protein with 3'-5' exonuclease and polymerase domains